MKKTIAAILSVLLLISCLTVNVFAENENMEPVSTTVIEETTDTSTVSDSGNDSIEQEGNKQDSTNVGEVTGSTDSEIIVSETEGQDEAHIDPADVGEETTDTSTVSDTGNKSIEQEGNKQDSTIVSEATGSTDSEINLSETDGQNEAQADPVDGSEETDSEDTLDVPEISALDTAKTNADTPETDSAVFSLFKTRAVDTKVLVDGKENVLFQTESGLWSIDYDKNGAFEIYQAIAFEKKHFTVVYGDLELHGNCNDDTHGQNKLVPSIENRIYQYVYKDNGSSVFSLIIDAGIDNQLENVTASTTINNKIYGFSKVEGCNLFVVAAGEDTIPPENFDSRNLTISLSVSGSQVLDSHLNGGGPYEGYSVEFYIIVWFKTANGFEHACFALRANNNTPFIKPQGDPNSYNSDFNNNEFRWIFVVGAEVFYSNQSARLSFVNNTAQTVRFYQTQNSINQIGKLTVENTNDGFAVNIPYGKEARFRVEKGSSVQEHVIMFDCDFNDIRDKSPIKSIDFNNMWINPSDSVFNTNSHKFDSVSLNTQFESSAFESLLNTVQQNGTVNLQDYYSVVLKEGYSVTGKAVSEILNTNMGKMVKLTYSVSNGTDSSLVVINTERKNSQSDMSRVSVDGKGFYLDETIDNTRIYIPEAHGPYLEFDANEIYKAVNSDTEKHGAVFLDYSYEVLHDNNSENSYPREVSDGYEVDPVRIVSLKLYYLDNLGLMNSGKLSYKDLTEVTVFNNPVNTRFDFNDFDNYKGALEHRMQFELKMPYKVNGSLFTPASRKTSPDQTTGVSVWVDYAIENNRIRFYRNISFIKPAELIQYNVFGSEDGHFSYDRVIYVGNQDYPASAEGLEKAVNELRNTGRSAVVLLSDITLERNVNLKHTAVERNEEPDSPLLDIELNLNGHNIDTDGHSLVNLRTSGVHITNRKIDENGKLVVLHEAHIISTNADSPTVINYGRLHILDNIKIVNGSGTGIETYNSGDLFLAKNTIVEAGVCVDVKENEVFSDGRENALISVSGNLKAVNTAIRSVTVESDIINNINLYSQTDGNTQKLKITSDGTGIRTVGNVSINVFGCEIDAKNPLIMSGGTVEIRHADFSSTDGSPVILIDSKHVNATKTTILIATESNVSMSTAGTLIREEADVQSKIGSIYFYSINSHDESYFDYKKLFDFSVAPAKDSVLINGGCFSDRTYHSYLQGSSLDERTKTKGNKTYYYKLKKGNIHVSNYNELESALMDMGVDSVRLTEDITAPAGSEIKFVVNSPKVLFTDGYTIKNVKLIPVTSISSSPKAFFTIDNEGRKTGEIVNDGTVIDSYVKELFIRTANIKSTADVAVKVNRGELYVIDEYADKVEPVNKIEGTKAVEINTDNSDISIGDISFKNYNLTGTNGPAIDVLKTDRFSYLNLSNCNVKTVLKDNTSNSSAVRISDRTRLSAQYSTVIEGTKYGVYFTDNLPGEGFVNQYAGLQLSGATKVRADRAFRLGNYTTVHLDGAFVEAVDSVMELHGFTQYSITSGEYKVTRGDDVITFVGVNPDDDYNWHRITGGYYSHELPDNEIFNDPRSEYFYDCMPVSLSNNPLPWLVARRRRDRNNYQYIEVPPGRDVEVDDDRLDNAYDEEETSGYESFDVVLTVKYKNDPSTKDKFDGHGNGFKEYYDIHVDKAVDNVAVENIDSTKNYQHITIPLNNLNLDSEKIIYANIDNVKVYHKHGNSDPVTLKKINANNAGKAKEECFYLEEIGGTWYLNIITRQFSDFAIAEDSEAVKVQDLKTDYDLILQYADSYEMNEITVPDYAIYGNGQSISFEDVDIVYYNAEGTDWYYSDRLPEKPGTYIAEWTVKEGKAITGSGTKSFIVENENPVIRNGLVYNKEYQNLVIDSYDYYYAAIKSSSYPGYDDFKQGMPVAKDAGTYNVYYYKSDRKIRYLGIITIAKADLNIEDITIPSFRGVEKGKTLGELKFSEPGWNWVSPKAAAGDSNYAVYNPDKNNYNDLLVSVPVYITETVAGIDVNISNTVSSLDDKDIDEVTLENNAISQSVIDVIKNKTDSKTKVSREVLDFIKSVDSGTLTISTEFVKSEISGADKGNAINAVKDLSGNGEIAMVLDLSVKITAEDENGTVKSGLISELSQPVKLTFKLPEGSKTAASEGKELKYYVLVIHNGSVHKLPATLNADGTVTFEAYMFSTYILVSEETEKIVTDNDTPADTSSQYRKPAVNTSCE